MSKQVSIIGCGWLGLPLGQSLFESGYQVKGTTTSSEKLTTLSEANIQPFQVVLPEIVESLPEVLKTDVLIINTPPSNKKSSTDFYTQLLTLANAAQSSQVKHLVFVSTTAVYGNLCREVVETDADYITSPHSGVAMLKMEEVFTKNPAFNTTVLRFGGLYGPKRNPGRFLSGKKGLSGGQNPVNMVHLDDCIGAIHTLLEQEAWGEQFNVCADEHPSRMAFYTAASEKAGLVAPQFDAQSESPYKIVNSDKFKAATGYKFKHPNPLNSL